jgi:hypothetical protein
MDAPDTDFAGYPANRKAGYRISGAGQILDIRLCLRMVSPSHSARAV